MAEPDEEKLEKIFAILRGPELDEDEKKILDTAWPHMVEKARIEAERRIKAKEEEARFRRRPILLGVVALAACVVIGLGVARFVGTDPHPHPRYDPWAVKSAHRFATWPGDLTEKPVFDDACRAVGADEAQRVAFIDLAAETIEKLEGLPAETPPATIAAVHSDMRARMADRLSAEQKKRLLEFCAERDRGR